MQDVLDATDGTNTLRIDTLLGSTNDLTSTGQGWAQGADQLIDTITYNVFTSGGATLLVDQEIIQDIS